MDLWAWRSGPRGTQAQDMTPAEARVIAQEAYIYFYPLVIMDVSPEISALTGTSIPISSNVTAPVFAKRSITFVIRKSSGCALASSSHVSGIDTGAPGEPRGE